MAPPPPAVTAPILPCVHGAAPAPSRLAVPVPPRPLPERPLPERRGRDPLDPPAPGGRLQPAQPHKIRRPPVPPHRAVPPRQRRRRPHGGGEPPKPARRRRRSPRRHQSAAVN